MHRSIGTILTALVLVAIGATGAAAAVPADSTPASSTSTAELAHDTPAATFDNQTSGGTTVTVQSVALPDGGFVTIHDATVSAGGTEVFSSVRGASAYLDPGVHENVTVTLSQPVDNDTTLVAMPHEDTNDDHTYSFVSSGGEADGPYTNDGDVVVDSASVTVSASVTYTASQTNGNVTTVDRVELSEDGFVTIHDSSLLDGATFDSVRGVSAPLEAGVHENVRVPFDEPLESDDTLVAMPHRDTNDNAEYDFVTSEGAADGPFTDENGDIVLAASQVELVDDTAASVTMTDQASGGDLVYVESAFLPSGGFVTAHDSSLLDGETFDSVRGTSAYLEPGHHEHVPITLDEPLEERDTLVAMPHRDTNDNGEYDFVTSEGAEDGPYTDENGDIVLDSGDVTYGAGVHIHDQESGGNTVTVATVDLSEDGFVTIHDSSLTAGATFDSVRGVTFLEAGLHENVTVTLDEPLRTTQPVYAMPHEDTNDNGEYDFVTSEGAADGPVTADGNIVLEGADVTVLSQTTFGDQMVSGDTVTVDSTTLHDGGFVTIHDASLTEGKPFASVLGTSEYLAPGTHENVTVTLDETPTTDGTLFAMPHRDTNDNQAYDFVTSEGAEDGPYTVAGDVAFVPAEVTVPAQATVTFDNQSTNGDSLTVASTTLSKGGFVTIHDSSLLDGETFDSVRGTSQFLEAGRHEDVEVTLDEPVEERGTFVAMPHLDTNDNEAYDFVTSDGSEDGPYTTEGGDIVLDDASVTLEPADGTETGGDGGSMDGTGSAMDGDDASGASPSDGNGPGFGLAAALVALAGAALIAARRSD
jgi:PGF-CTERM protein